MRCDSIARVVVLVSSAVLLAACGSSYHFDRLPRSLSDEEFSRVMTSWSEAPGAFPHSDNLVSNETDYANTISLLRPRGGAYIGVGPEQNFSYIARIQPEIAFIVDVRRENLALHLLYKALFELSLDRSEFVSRLFSREKPSGLGEGSSAQELFAKYASAPASAERLEATKRTVRYHLLENHAFAVSAEDLAWIDRALTHFFSAGPEVRYASPAVDTASRPSYRSLMTMPDVKGTARSYLASERSFAFVKRMHARNMIVPVVGDFSGPTALRRIGEYIRRHGGLVSAFYSSNVDVYLSKQQSLAFCANLDALPSHSQTWFIHSKGIRLLPAKLASCLFKPGRPGTTR